MVGFQSKKDDKDQESIQSSTTPDPGYLIGKCQNHNWKLQTRATFPSLFIYILQVVKFGPEIEHDLLRLS